MPRPGPEGGGGPEKRPEVVPSRQIQKANDRDFTDLAVALRAALRRIGIRAKERNLSPKDVLLELKGNVERNPSPQNKLLLLQVGNEFLADEQGWRALHDVLKPEDVARLYKLGGQE